VHLEQIRKVDKNRVIASAILVHDPLSIKVAMIQIGNLNEHKYMVGWPREQYQGQSYYQVWFTDRNKRVAAEEAILSQFKNFLGKNVVQPPNQVYITCEGVQGFKVCFGPGDAIPTMAKFWMYINEHHLQNSATNATVTGLTKDDKYLFGKMRDMSLMALQPLTCNPSNMKLDPKKVQDFVNKGIYKAHPRSAHWKKIHGHKLLFSGVLVNKQKFTPDELATMTAFMMQYNAKIAQTNNTKPVSFNHWFEGLGFKKQQGV